VYSSTAMRQDTSDDKTTGRVFWRAPPHHITGCTLLHNTPDKHPRPPTTQQQPSTKPTCTRPSSSSTREATANPASVSIASMTAWASLNSSAVTSCGERVKRPRRKEVNERGGWRTPHCRLSCQCERVTRTRTQSPTQQQAQALHGHSPQGSHKRFASGVRTHLVVHTHTHAHAHTRTRTHTHKRTRTSAHAPPPSLFAFHVPARLVCDRHPCWT